MVTVIIPAYNAELYIERCLDSVVAQTLKDFEVLIVNDGSIDRTGKLVDRFAREYPFIRVIHKENGGSASARNVGIKEARGDFIAFVDADDFIHPQYIEILTNAEKHTHSDIIQCGFQITYSDNVPIKAIEDEPAFTEYNNIQFLEKFCNKKTYLSTTVLWNKLYKRALFDDLEFPTNRGIDDEYLICQIIYRAKQITVVDNELYYYFMSENSQMRSRPTLKSIDNVEAIENQLTFFESIGQPKLYNMLLYRYYSAVSGAYQLVKREFPEEHEILLQLEAKKKTWRKALHVREIPLEDKLFLIIRVCFPHMFRVIHRKVKR
ncbi:MAG: glycosyltransferase [Clostridiales bacterium]|nr:glycosyltransferase [Clostridiales bacterium]